MSEKKVGGRWALRATNHERGEVWAIEDTKARCDRALAAKLSDWNLTEDDESVTVEWARVKTED